MHHEIAKIQNDFSFFIELGKPLSRAKSIKETFDVIMYQIGDIFQPENWSLLLHDAKTDEMIFTIVVGSNKQDLQGMRLPKGKGRYLSYSGKAGRPARSPRNLISVSRLLKQIVRV